MWTLFVNKNKLKTHVEQNLQCYIVEDGQRINMLFVSLVGIHTTNAVADYLDSSRESIHKALTEGYKSYIALSKEGCYRKAKRDLNTCVAFEDLKNCIDVSIINARIVEGNIERIIMPNGVDGLYCDLCKQWFAYVEPNHTAGFVCKDCRDNL